MIILKNEIHVLKNMTQDQKERQKPNQMKTTKTKTRIKTT